MQKVIIDTNIYYSLVGISENLKVNKDSFLNYDKYITSATLIECIIKYKNDLTTLKKIIKPLMDNEYQLISIDYVPIDKQSANKYELPTSQKQLRTNTEKYMLSLQQNPQKVANFFKHPKVQYAG